jgi:hypothetical protein
MSTYPPPTAEQLQRSNPILMEALADAAHCTPAEAAETFTLVDPESRRPVCEFLDQYT